MRRKSFLDFSVLARQFNRGDIVFYLSESMGQVVEVPGVVTAVLPKIGFIDVEWPWGNERVSPEYLIKQNPSLITSMPNVVDTSSHTWEIIESFKEDGTYSEDGSNFKKFSSDKKAIYWSDTGRVYQMTQDEMEDGLPNCPRCDSNMAKTNYKKHTKLFVCPDCLFCIKPSDIQGLTSSDEGDDF